MPKIIVHVMSNRKQNLKLPCLNHIAFCRQLRESWEAHKTFQQDLYAMEAQRRRELEEERRKHIHYRDIAFHRRRELEQGKTTSC